MLASVSLQLVHLFKDYLAKECWLKYIRILFYLICFTFLMLVSKRHVWRLGVCIAVEI